MSNCKHTFDAGAPGEYEAIVPVEGEALTENGEVKSVRVATCNQCGTPLVSDGVLVEELPHTYPNKCACGKPLTEPYAKKMGECVACKLDRLRNGRGRGFKVDGGMGSEERKAYQRRYSRRVRQKETA